MILGVLIVIGGLATNIFMLSARGTRVLEHSFPIMRMMGSGLAVTTGLGVMLQGVLVTGFGMLLYLLGDIALPKTTPEPDLPAKAVKDKETKRIKK
jgi:hypothetical protein